MNWADYQVGRRVVCIADFNDVRDLCSAVPDIGKVYTIREVLLGYNFDNERVLSLSFAEFSSFGIPGAEYQPPNNEWLFHAAHFKPLDERRIDQFRQLLRKRPAPSEFSQVPA